MAAAAAAAVGGGSGGHGVSGAIGSGGGGGVGLRLGRGPELMRRLCAINQQFATSVMEDYIRPIGELVRNSLSALDDHYFLNNFYSLHRICS